MADTTIPSGSAPAVKRWGGGKTKRPNDTKPSKAEPPARCAQFCQRRHVHVR